MESQNLATQNLCESKINMPSLDGPSAPGTRHSLVGWVHAPSCFRGLWEVPKPAVIIGHWKNSPQKKKGKKNPRGGGMQTILLLAGRRNRRRAPMSAILVLWRLFLLFPSASLKCHEIRGLCCSDRKTLMRCDEESDLSIHIRRKFGHKVKEKLEKSRVMSGKRNYFFSFLPSSFYPLKKEFLQRLIHIQRLCYEIMHWSCVMGEGQY